MADGEVLVEILRLIQSDSHWTAPKLMKHFDVCDRSIRRYIAALRVAGYPVLSGPKGYYLARDFLMRSVQLSVDEALAINALVGVAANGKVPFSSAAIRGLTKIRSQLPAMTHQELELVDRHIDLQFIGQSTQNLVSGTEEYFLILRGAIAGRRAVHVGYESRNSGKTETFYFKPYALHFNQRAWYAIGLHGTRQEVRTLKLNRFTEMTLTDVTYTIPADFSVTKHFGNAWRMIRGKQTYQVELLIDEEFSETLADTVWHVSQENEYVGKQLKLNFTIDGLEEIIWWILSLGSHCQVLNPPELQQRLADEIALMQKTLAR